MGGGSSSETKKEEPTMDASMQMTENSAGFHVLEIHMHMDWHDVLLLVGLVVH